MRRFDGHTIYSIFPSLLKIRFHSRKVINVMSVESKKWQRIKAEKQQAN